MHDSIDDFPPIHRKKDREIRRGLSGLTTSLSQANRFDKRVLAFIRNLHDASAVTRQMATPNPILRIALNWYVLGRTVASCFSEISLDTE